MQQNITSFQIVGAVIAFILGYACRLGLEYEQPKKKMTFWRGLFMFVFSLATASGMFIYTAEKDLTISIKLLIIALSSFFGSVVVPGLGGIKADFFTDIFKDLIRKWVNSPKTINDESNETLSPDDAMYENEKSS